MSSRRQEELSTRLDQILDLPAVAALKPEPRTRRVHHDWLEAGEHTQRMVAQLSQQLRRFLDDRAFQENRRILELLRNIETKALALRDMPPTGEVMLLDEMGADIALPQERPLFALHAKPRLAELILESGEDDDIDTTRLFDQHVVDKTRLREALRQALRQQSQISLRALLETQPLQQGLAELVTWLELAHAGSRGLDGLRATVDDDVQEIIEWAVQDAPGSTVRRRARMPRVIFTR